MPTASRSHVTISPLLPAAPLGATVTGPLRSFLDDLGALDLRGDGQASDAARPPDLTILPSAATVLAAETGLSSLGAVSASTSVADQASAAPALQLQAGILEATGPQSYFAVVGSGSGSPVAYSGFTGQFSGPVSSAALDADPFSDRLLDVAAGDLVTFVIAAQNVGTGAAAWDVVLRDTAPAGFIVPAGGPTCT